MRIFIISILLALSATFAKANTLNFRSSDLLEGCTKATIANYIEQENKTLNIEFKGSLSTIKDIKSGKCDIAIVALTNPSEADFEGLQHYPIAYQSVTICVNQSNDIKELSLEDLKLMYFKTKGKFAKTWNEFGVNSTSAVQAVSTGLNDNLVVELFKNTVSPSENLADWVNIISPEAQLATFVNRNNAAIAIAGKALEGTKEVPIISPITNFATFATPESLYKGEYPLNLTFYLVFDAKNIAKIRDVAKFLLEKNIAEAFKNGGFYAVPEIFRKNFILGLDIYQ